MVLHRCEECGKTFRKTEHYKRHQRSHTKERPYECQDCHKRYSRSDVLSRHRRAHARPSHDASGSAAQNDPALGPSQPAPFLVSTPQQLQGPEHQASLPSAGGSDAHQGPGSNLDTLQNEVVLDSTGALPSSFAFLTNVSVHPGHESPANGMTLGAQQQAYLEWNNMSAIDPALQRHDMLNPRAQARTLEHPFPSLEQWPRQTAESSSPGGWSEIWRDRDPGVTSGSVDLTSSDHIRNVAGRYQAGIPVERFEKVKRCWLAPPNLTGRLMNRLWIDVVGSPSDNLLSEPVDYATGRGSPFQEFHRSIDENCRRRFQSVVGQNFASPQVQSPSHEMKSSLSTVSSSTTANSFPQAEIFDMALDLYFRTFHSLLPFVHLPTFSAKSTRTPLLWVMCLIGLMLMGTEGATSFVSKNFKLTLDTIMADLAQCTVGAEQPAAAISTFATALLFLNLAVLTDERTHLEQCQMLYVNLMTIAQRHGLFAAIGGQPIESRLSDVSPDPDTEWKAWSKIETMKRIIIGLILTDSWYSALLSTSPIIVPDFIQIHLPSDESLFSAPSSSDWKQLIHDGKRNVMPTVLAPSENVDIPSLEGHMDELCVQTVLAIVQLRQSEAYHRLLSNRTSSPLAPCNTYAMDGRARCLPSLEAQIINSYGEAMDRSNPNTIVMWHYMCMTLTADIRMFESAAGRDGPHPAQKALDDIAQWSRTAAARRACLHAAQIYKAMFNRKASEYPNCHSVFSLFLAALVLGLYTFMAPPPSENESSNVGSIELMGDVNWQQVGTEGFTSFLEPRGSQSYSPSSDPAVSFIRNGGTMYMQGVPIQGGYQPARRVMLDFANLLRNSGKWSVKKFSYVLQIMSDVLMDVE